MATTGIVNSRIMTISVGSTVVTCLTDANLNISVESRDTTCKDTDSYNSSLPGRVSWTMGGSAMFAYDNTYTFDDIYALINTGATATVKIGTNVQGDKTWSGTAFFTSLSLSSSGSDENVTFDFELQGTGALTEATNP